MSLNIEISVIVPVYNVEKFLDKCIQSIVNQTFYEYEILIINDGSTDNSEKIINAWVKRDNRIRYFKTVNRGLSEARNLGISNARGRFICFVDSDDYVDKNYLKLLYKSINENNTDIAQCCFELVSDDDYHIRLNKEPISLVYDSKTALEKLIDTSDNTIEDFVWNKIYKKELFDTLRFKKGVYYEDLEIMYKIIMNINAISILNVSLYCYRKSFNSISRTINIDKIKQFISFIDVRYVNLLNALDKKILDSGRVNSSLFIAKQLIKYSNVISLDDIKGIIKTENNFFKVHKIHGLKLLELKFLFLIQYNAFNFLIKKIVNKKRSE